VRQIKKNRTFASENGACGATTGWKHGPESRNPLSVVDLLSRGVMGLLTDGIAQEEPITEQGYEREELGVKQDNRGGIETG